MQEVTTLPLRSRIKYRKKSWLRKAIIFIQRLSVFIGVIMVVLTVGTVGGIENNRDLFYGTIKIVCYVIGVFLAYSSYNLLDRALLWEHKNRIEQVQKKSA